MNSIKDRLLYLTSEGRGLLYRQLAFYLVDLRNGKTKMIAHLPVGRCKKFIGSFRIGNRLLRLEPKCIGQFDENRFAVSIIGKLWVVDIELHSLSALGEMRQGYSLLSFCQGCNGLYYGDYGTNPNHEGINIYKIDHGLNRQTVYTFPPTSIRHIHSILKDGDGFIVLAGDNEPCAGIYRANSDWTEVKPWKIGEQKYRAVVGFPYKRGLLYATDSVETDNQIRLIEADGTERILATINGSCIYGGETKNYYLFSTTVEPHEGRKLLHKFTYKLGGGIKSREVHIIAVSKKNLSIKVVEKLKKDWWPMVLFQYGRVRFAGGQENVTGGVWYSPVACQGDGRSFWLHI